MQPTHDIDIFKEKGNHPLEQLSTGDIRLSITSNF